MHVNYNSVRCAYGSMCLVDLKHQQTSVAKTQPHLVKRSCVFGAALPHLIHCLLGHHSVLTRWIGHHRQHCSSFDASLMLLVEPVEPSSHFSQPSAVSR